MGESMNPRRRRRSASCWRRGGSASPSAGVQVLFSVNFRASRRRDPCPDGGERRAAKSTLVKILSGFEQPSSGEVLLDGQAGNASCKRRGRKRWASSSSTRNSISPNI